MAISQKVENSKAKILILDIETAPIKALVWRVWKENIAMDAIKSDWFILTWAAKWLNEKKIFGERLISAEVKKENDKRIIKPLWLLFDEADIIIAHNGNNFDIPKINSRFFLNGLPPPSPYVTIDTLKIAQKQFAFTHNKLDYLARLFGLGQKIKTDFNLWVKCLEGEEKALAFMLKYNKKDILLLEEVYLKFRGWIKSHPNLNIFQGTQNTCSNCGSLNIYQKGKYTTNLSKFATYVCRDCGAFSRASKKMLTSVGR